MGKVQENLKLRDFKNLQLEFKIVRKSNFSNQ